MILLFIIVDEEVCLGDFSCALSDDFLLHGRIYITNKKIVFFSRLDNSNSFRKTIIEIPKEDILKVEKKSNSVFNNILALLTKSASYLFTSFLYRDQCYDVIKEELKNSKNTFNNNNKQ